MLALAAIGATIFLCLVAHLLKRHKVWLPSTVQFLSGLVAPPVVAWLAFEYGGEMTGNHNSGAFLLLIWFLCVIIGMLFSRATDRREGSPK